MPRFKNVHTDGSFGIRITITFIMQTRHKTEQELTFLTQDGSTVKKITTNAPKPFV